MPGHTTRGYCAGTLYLNPLKNNPPGIEKLSNASCRYAALLIGAMGVILLTGTLG
ncbi:MAG: hypothetical protein AAGB01_07185 [Cyanobacteria bacterium P01_F01_bin.42]